MAREFVSRSKELPQIFRPRHQWDFPMWETRDELNQPHRLGFPKFYVDGVKAVLAKNGGTALNPGVYVEVPFTSLSDSNLPKVADIRDDQVTILSGTTAIAKDLYKDGRLIITGGIGVGHSFPVTGNTIGAGSAATDTIVVHLGAQLPIALDLTTDVRVITSRYRNLRVGTGSGELVVGFIPIAVPANDYFWLIQEGPTAAIAGETITPSTAANIDLKPVSNGRLSLRNAALDEGSQLVASFAQNAAVAAAGYMQVMARIGG